MAAPRSALAVPTPRGRNHQGFLTLDHKDRQRIADVTGAYGIQFDAPVPNAVMAIGYPSTFPSDGESLQYCHGSPRTAAQSRITFA